MLRGLFGAGAIRQKKFCYVDGKKGFCFSGEGPRPWPPDRLSGPFIEIQIMLRRLINHGFARPPLTTLAAVAVACFLAMGMLLIAPTPSNAGVIIGPVSATTDMGEIDTSTPISNLLNRSGLFPGMYAAGTTDFDAYTSATSHDRGIFSVNSWLSASGVRTGRVDFDLGQTYQVESFALWNGRVTQGILGFRLFASSDAAFTSSTLIGSFTAASVPDVAPAQVFTFAPTSAAYVRLVIDSVQGAASTTSIGEVAFEVPAPVSASLPEPATLTMCVLAAPLALFGLKRRSRRA